MGSAQAHPTCVCPFPDDFSPVGVASLAAGPRSRVRRHLDLPVKAPAPLPVAREPAAGNSNYSIYADGIPHRRSLDGQCRRQILAPGGGTGLRLYLKVPGCRPCRCDYTCRARWGRLRHPGAPVPFVAALRGLFAGSGCQAGPLGALGHFAGKFELCRE